MPRSCPEWIGKTPDSAIPPRVKLRIADRQRPATGELPICPCCGQPIRDGDGTDFDHVIPLIDGGRHAESNLRAVHRRCHRLKTAREAQERAEVRARQKSALGIKRPGTLPGSRIKYSRARGLHYDRFTGEIIEDTQP